MKKKNSSRCHPDRIGGNTFSGIGKASDGKAACSRRQKAKEGRLLCTNWKGIVTPPNGKPPNQRFGRGFTPLLHKSRGQRAERIPSSFCLLPFAFFGDQYGEAKAV
jgi:hypothetical protein